MLKTFRGLLRDMVGEGSGLEGVGKDGERKGTNDKIEADTKGTKGKTV